MRTYHTYHVRTYTQYAHDVVLTSVRRRSNVMDVVWTSKQRRLLTGYYKHYIVKHQFKIHIFLFEFITKIILVR